MTEPVESKKAARERMTKVAMELMVIGVSQSRIVPLLSFGLDRVERQLKWLPYRKARKPASLIVKAIEEDYDAPANWEGHEA